MDDRATWLDLFAAGLERNLTVEQAAAALGKTKWWGRLALGEIIAGLEAKGLKPGLDIPVTPRR